MWLTAISSINITHWLIIYFYMNKDDVAPSQKKIVSGRQQFKLFCKLNSMNKCAFFELNALGLRLLHLEWISLINNNPEHSIPMLMAEFGTCMERVKIQVHNLLTERIRNLDALIAKSESIIANFK